MKKLLLFFAVLLLMLCLSGCGSAEKNDGLLVILEAGDSFSTEENALHVRQGEDAVFLLTLRKSVTILSTDYQGDYEITEKDGQTALILRGIRYPTRVRLQLAAKSGQIRYEANGGTAADGSKSFVKSHSLSVHPRANTAIGADSFAREGYTLIGWNTKADGSGERIGLGSRVTLSGGETVLYAQWARWNDGAEFSWAETDGGLTITGWRGTSETLIIPAQINGKPVRAIATGAFRACAAQFVILPSGLHTVADGAFTDARLTELTLFDDIEDISDAAFTGCERFQTLHINAAEAPFGYVYRKESVYADKVDLLLLAQGRKKLVFYGGCSMWYNLDGIQADKRFGSEYAVLNLALNGTVSSAVQLQIMAPYLEPGDILFHTPEIASRPQLMLTTGMGDDDSSLWCGLENNYDLFTLVDLRTVDGVFDSFCRYLSLKDKRTDYNQFFSDDYRTPYLDRYGCVSFYRSEHKDKLPDRVTVKPELLSGESLDTLGDYYAMLRERGVRIYVSCACVNLDALPAGQEAEISAADAAFRQTLAGMGVTPISHMEDYLFREEDYYDTNYHLLSEPAKRNTTVWMRDLLAQMVQDGIWDKEADT